MLENRAWSGCELFGFAVTFCEEGVDWNTFWMSAYIGTWYRHLLWGRCGLKWRCWQCCYTVIPSPSVRKVWIEIFLVFLISYSLFCHLLWGRCGLKCVIAMGYRAKDPRHLLWGRCGLKYPSLSAALRLLVSPSVRKVWIEMYKASRYRLGFPESPSVRKVWIEIAPSVDLHWILTQF